MYTAQWSLKSLKLNLFSLSYANQKTLKFKLNICNVTIIYFNFLLNLRILVFM